MGMQCKGRGCGIMNAKRKLGEEIMATAIVNHPLYLEHYQPGHPESPQRLRAILSALDASSIRSRLTPLQAGPVSLERLQRVHTPDYVGHIRTLAESGGDAWHGGET